jgi:hypothetical protein
MTLAWMEVSLLTILFGLAGLLIGRGLSSLFRRGAPAARRNRQATCRHHDWTRRESGGLVCRRCGKIPG